MKTKKRSSKVILPPWNKKTLMEKILTVLSIIFCILVLLFVLLATFSSLKYANEIFEIFLILLFTSEAIMFYKYDKNSSKIIFICISVILICFLINVFV